jgi:hypothetical protein
MKLFNQRNPLKKLSAIFGAYVRGDAPDHATSPQGIVPQEFTRPADDSLKDKKKEFFRAVRLEDMPALTAILAEYPDAAHWREPDILYPETGLLVAAMHNCPKAAALLCAHNADLTAADTTGCSALIIAAGGHHLEVVKVLLDYKSPLDIESTLGDTALLAAIKHLQRLQSLAETNPDLVPKSNYDTIRTLIEAGADPTQFNKNGLNSYMLADTLQDKEVYLSVLGARQTRMDNADIQAGKKPVIRIMKPLRLK